ncbi:MAG: 4-hydroxy-tetrahydrodipicolinate synthase [Clostridia bacterium]|nr:4-hydroxy-tetrahydrodipicolinate synthase [Clostridia bacterium]
MQKNTVFTGAAVAIVTPFTNNQVNYDQLGALIERQIAGSTDAIVICGTTGEASTLTDEEHRECIRYCVEKVAGRVPVIAGTGSNDTDYAIDLSKYACEVGADALLLVTPYYNKATPKGLVKSFLAVADATDKPIILYNVPGRTGCSITLPVYKELAKHERIVSTKEASGIISAIAEIAAEVPELDIYSGNDDQIVPLLALGAKGVISVLSNVVPKETHDIVALFLEGKVKESAKLQLELLKLANTLFCEVNPVPVKTAMAMMGFCSEEMRLPLCEMEESNKAKLAAVLKEYKVI